MISLYALFLSQEIEKYVIRYNEGEKYFVDDEHYNSNKIINYIDQFKINDKIFDYASGAGIENVLGNSRGNTSRKQDVQAFSPKDFWFLFNLLPLIN